jgi:hypothetical protein
MIKDPALRRFWVEFEKDEGDPWRYGLGFGVTAYNEVDALSLLAESVCKNSALPPVRKMIADVAISDLDQGHVIPNMESPIWRGVWYPRGHMPHMNKQGVV